MNIRVVLAVTTLIEFIGLGVVLSVWERWGLTDLWYMLLPLEVWPETSIPPRPAFS